MFDLLLFYLNIKIGTKIEKRCSCRSYGKALVSKNPDFPSMYINSDIELLLGLQIF